MIKRLKKHTRNERKELKNMYKKVYYYDTILEDENEEGISDR